MTVQQGEFWSGQVRERYAEVALERVFVKKVAETRNELVTGTRTRRRILLQACFDERNPCWPSIERRYAVVAIDVEQRIDENIYAPPAGDDERRRLSAKRTLEKRR